MAGKVCAKMIDAPHFVAYVFANKSWARGRPDDKWGKGRGSWSICICDGRSRRCFQSARAFEAVGLLREFDTERERFFFGEVALVQNEAALSINPFANFGDGEDGQVPNDRSFVEIADRAGCETPGQQSKSGSRRFRGPVSLIVRAHDLV
jgi:hypothetical protein